MVWKPNRLVLWLCEATDHQFETLTTEPFSKLKHLEKKRWPLLS